MVNQGIREKRLAGGKNLIASILEKEGLTLCRSLRGTDR